MNKNTSKKRRQFYSLVLIVVSGIAVYKGIRGQLDLAALLGTIAALPWILETLAPSFSALAFDNWIKFGDFLGKINSYLVVFVMFVLVLTPLGLLLRVLGKRNQYTSQSRSKRSSWVEIKENRPMEIRYSAPY